jgi:hypothetical protein
MAVIEQKQATEQKQNLEQLATGPLKHGEIEVVNSFHWKASLGQDGNKGKLIIQR